MDLNEIKNKSFQEISDSRDEKSLEDLRVKYLGRSGILTEVLKSLKDLSLEEKKELGPKANILRKELEEKISQKKKEILAGGGLKPIDITTPGEKIETGHLHPLTQVKEEIIDIFSSMGFSVAEGPEIENDFYNFEALNIPLNHPARGMWDTFWLKEKTKDKRASDKKLLLRPHTSPVQIRHMEKNNPPIRMITLDKVFRYEAIDAGHNIQFQQFECLMVDENISLVNFKTIVTSFFKRFFSKQTKVRFRPSYFPFVEPGIEIDFSCPQCQQKGCSLCGQTGWIEIAGAGMVHPNVFKSVGYNPKNWQGFAWGFGLDRITMIKYNIPDIRLLYSGDLRVIKQF